MIDHIIKVSIYRIQKYTAGAKEVELFLHFRNPNRSKAIIQFYPLLQSQDKGQTNIKINLPVGELTVDTSEINTSSGVSVAPSNATNV